MTFNDFWAKFNDHGRAEPAERTAAREAWLAAVAEGVKRIKTLQDNYRGASRDKYDSGDVGGALKDLIAAQALDALLTLIELKEEGRAPTPSRPHTPEATK